MALIDSFTILYSMHTHNTYKIGNTMHLKRCKETKHASEHFPGTGCQPSNQPNQPIKLSNALKILRSTLRDLNE